MQNSNGAQDTSAYADHSPHNTAALVVILPIKAPTFRWGMVGRALGVPRNLAVLLTWGSEQKNKARFEYGVS